MTGIQRHYFPGNNTPYGFYSYYNNILTQEEAERIYCIKGGPGTGKSSLMMKVGRAAVEKGMDVDFLHCSSDEKSLDGIIIKNRSIAIIDGTAPHITDPLTPGAVDEIIDLYKFTDSQRLKDSKKEIMALTGKIAGSFKKAAGYFRSAQQLHRMLGEEYNIKSDENTINNIIDEIYEKEFHYRKKERPGKKKSFFASAFTPSGCVNYINSLIDGYIRVYLILKPVGSDTDIMKKLSQMAIRKGFNVEEFYCSMEPKKTIDHLLLKEIKTAFITCNSFHNIRPWEINGAEMMIIDLSNISLPQDFCEHVTNQIDELVNDGVRFLEQAHNLHNQLEEYYIRVMDFEKTDILAGELIDKIL